MAIAWFLIIVCLFFILHAYLFYPIILFLLPKTKSRWKDSIPNCSVAVIIAAYNEEGVIGDKVKSVLNNLPKHLDLEIYVGSDASTDNTDKIIENISRDHHNVHLVRFGGRTGKAAIINQLTKDKRHDIFILTDANVIFTENTISELLIPFQKSEVSMVCANILKISNDNKSFGNLEKSYINYENRMKKMESDLWQFVIGAEGGCYAIRSKDYKDVPKNFYMDDFFMTMQVLENNKEIIFQKNAICKEDIPNLASEEFKRKTRISIGNFQNLNRFKHLLVKNRIALSFAFISHKILRWHTPIFLIIILFCSGFLSFYYSIIFPFLLIQLTLLLSPVWAKLKIRIPIVSSLIYFYSMNIALFYGMVLYLKGVKSNVWEPTLRKT